MSIPMLESHYSLKWSLKMDYKIPKWKLENNLRKMKMKTLKTEIYKM
jgi:hypothetical protein